jgi:hypothetical protein
MGLKVGEGFRERGKESNSAWTGYIGRPVIVATFDVPRTECFDSRECLRDSVVVE